MTAMAVLHALTIYATICITSSSRMTAFPKTQDRLS